MPRTSLIATVFVVAILAGTVLSASAVAVHVADGHRPDPSRLATSVSTGVPSTAVPTSSAVGTVGDLGSRRLGYPGALGLQPFDLPGLVLFAGYSRFDDSDPLANTGRRRIYDAIEASPGTYPVELAAATGIPRSTVRYHVRILEEEGLIVTSKQRGKRRYFPRDSDDVELLGALREPASRSVLRAVARMEPASVSAIASAIDRAPSTVSYHLSNLVDAGLVEQRRADGAVRNRLTDGTREGLRRYVEGAADPSLGSTTTP